MLAAVPEFGAAFEGQAVGRDVVGLERDGGIDVGEPLVERFAGCGKDEVEGDVQAGAFGESDGAADVAARVIAFQEFAAFRRGTTGRRGSAA